MEFPSPVVRPTSALAIMHKSKTISDEKPVYEDSTHLLSLAKSR